MEKIIIDLDHPHFVNASNEVSFPEHYIMNVHDKVLFTNEHQANQDLFLHGLLGENKLSSGTLKYYSNDNTASSSILTDKTLSKREISCFRSSDRTQLVYDSNMPPLARWNSMFREDSPQVNEFISGLDINTPNFNLLGISNLLEKTLMALSSGELQRVLLFKALGRKSRLLILQQPFLGLDQHYQLVLKELLENYNESALIIIDTDNSHALNIPSYTLTSSEVINHTVSQLETDKPHQTGQEAIVSLNNVTVTYNSRPILKNITFSIYPSQRLLITGANGSGKTTLLSLLSADNPQLYTNDVTLGGKHLSEMTSIWEWKLQVGIVCSDLIRCLSATHTVKDILISGYTQTTEPQPSTKYDQTELENLVHRIAPCVKLSDFFGRLTKLEKLEVLFIRAIIHQPKLLLLDELEAGITNDDYFTLLDIIGNELLNRSLAVLIVTHITASTPKWITDKIELKAPDS